ncbi:hypothetical protein MMC32_003621 [Xylographa parallela]|nr:hypothetical protein [Xylographa parallela]
MAAQTLPPFEFDMDELPTLSARAGCQRRKDGVGTEGPEAKDGEMPSRQPKARVVRPPLSAGSPCAAARARQGHPPKAPSTAAPPILAARLLASIVGDGKKKEASWDGAQARCTCTHSEDAVGAVPGSRHRSQRPSAASFHVFRVRLPSSVKGIGRVV